MKEKTRKLITIISLAVALLSCIFAVMFAIGYDPNPDKAKFGGMFDITFWVLVVLVVATLLAWLYFALKQLIKNFKEDPKKAKKTLCIIGALAVACVVAFLLASGNDVSDVVLDQYNVSTGASKLIGAGCILVYLLVAAAIISIIFVECAKSLKKK